MCWVPSSDRSVELEAGAATEIALKVAGDFFTKSGDYEITVKAMSKTDGAMTAEVTTTTTIEVKPTPVPPEVQPPTPEVPTTPVEPAVEPTPPTPWDVNADGTVDIRDIVLVSGEFGQSGESLKGDVNGDGTVDIRDVVLVASHFGEDTNVGQ